MARQTNRIVIGVIIAVIVIVPLGVIWMRELLPHDDNGDTLIEIPETDVRKFAININASGYEIGDTSPYHGPLTMIIELNTFYRALDVEDSIIKEIFGIKQSLEYTNGTKKIFILYHSGPDPSNPTITRHDGYVLLDVNGVWYFRTFFSNEFSTIEGYARIEMNAIVQTDTLSLLQ